jgi:hypothetical protein
MFIIFYQPDAVYDLPVIVVASVLYVVNCQKQTVGCEQTRQGTNSPEVLLAEQFLRLRLAQVCISFVSTVHSTCNS